VKRSIPPLLSLLLLLAAAPSFANSGHGYWLQAIPESLEEAALRDALTASAFAGAAGQAEALQRVSAAHPGTAASGLAQLAAGLLLLEAGQETSAIAPLSHTDIRKTGLVAHAFLGLGRAHELQSPEKAAAAYLTAADADPTAPTSCPALLRAGEAWDKARQAARAASAFERALEACKSQRPRALQRLAEVQEHRGETRAAAALYDRLDRDYPASPEALDTAARRRALAALVPAPTTEDRRARHVASGTALLEARQYTPAAAALRAALDSKPTGADLDRVRLLLGRALMGAKRVREAELLLAAIGSGAPEAAEAAYLLAHERARRGNVTAYESVVQRFPGTPWSATALFQLGNNEQKDARDADAAPYYRRQLQDSPNGSHVERAAWRVGFYDFRSRRFEDAATLLEGVARRRDVSSSTPGFLYWAGRARAALGQTEPARALYNETVRRFKHSYHGLKAREALAQLPPRPAAATASAPWSAGIRTTVAEPLRTRARQLLLVDRFEEAAEELRAAPTTTEGQATLAWIEWRRGHLRNAIIAMKKAYPEYIGEGGDLLPADVWKILFPIGFEETLAAKAAKERLDPTLVAALVCQESTFDPGAVSRVGARGLMQIMTPTGQRIARDLGLRFQRAALHDPATSLDFGTHYLRQMLDRFDGREELALAAYNAGPHRVDAWTAGRPEVSAEEFVETIPFTETRFYVMTILASREHYRRLYPLGQTSALAAGSGGS
jgi:soluble lytic murein transglycosylase